MSSSASHDSSDIMIPLDRIYVINEQDFVIDWGEQRVESLTDGRYFPAPAISSRHEISQYELDQLAHAGYINGYDDPNIIAGAGTLGVEMLEQVPDADVVVVPVGGAGLIAGVALAVKTLSPSVRRLSPHSPVGARYPSGH